MSLALSSLATMGFQAAPLVTRAAAASVSMSAIRPGARRRLHRALLPAAQHRHRGAAHLAFRADSGVTPDRDGIRANRAVHPGGPKNRDDLVNFGSSRDGVIPERKSPALGLVRTTLASARGGGGFLPGGNRIRRHNDGRRRRHLLGEDYECRDEKQRQDGPNEERTTR